MAQKTLIIVQNKPTQFDAPFFAYVQSRQLFRLVVFYTETHRQGDAGLDAEIGRAPLWDHLAAGGYERYDLNAQEAADPSRVVRQIAAHAPDLVVLCGYYPPLHRQLAWRLKLRGLRIGLRSDNTMPHSDFSGLKGVAKRLLLPAWLRLYDSWHPVGSLAREYLEKMAGPVRPVFLFPYSADNEWFATAARAYRRRRAELRAALGFNASDYVVLGIMKWHAREDPMTLLRAFEEVSRASERARLLLVGDGPLRGQVREAVRILGSKAHLPGYVAYSQLPKYYALSDVFVHPAVNEPWGVSVNEAMACGVPVIAASGVGAHADLISAGETGYVFANGDYQRLAQLLLSLATDAAMPARLGDNAEQRVAQWHYRQTLTYFEAALRSERKQ